MLELALLSPPRLLRSLISATLATLWLTLPMAAEEPVVIDVQEEIVVSDQVTVAPAVWITVQETATVTDTVAVTPAISILVSEAIAVVDAVVLSPAVQLEVLETISVTDSVATTIQFPAPPGVIRVHTVATTDNGRLDPGEVVTAAVTQIYLTFSQALQDLEGDNDPDDVTNPDNYLVLRPGPNGVFDTADCLEGPLIDDELIGDGPALYLSEQDTVALHLNAGVPIAEGDYQLMVCGSTGLRDTAGTALDGNGDGEPGDDFVMTFRLAADHALDNPNFDQAIEGWTVEFPPGATIEPAELDSDNAPTSGAALVDTRGAAGESWLSQCHEAEGVEEAQPVRFGARIQLIEALPETAQALAELLFFLEPGCSGPPFEQSDLLFDLENAASIWQPFEKAATLPEGTQSVRLRVGALTAEPDAAIFHVDDVFLAADLTGLFRDDFESGGVDAWSNAVGGPAGRASAELELSDLPTTTPTTSGARRAPEPER